MEQYYIQFQVWRPTGIERCYELVDYNIPLDDARMSETGISDSSVVTDTEGFLSPPGNNYSDSLHRCVVLPVRENQSFRQVMWWATMLTGSKMEMTGLMVVFSGLKIVRLYSGTPLNDHP